MGQTAFLQPKECWHSAGLDGLDGLDELSAWEARSPFMDIPEAWRAGAGTARARAVGQRRTCLVHSSKTKGVRKPNERETCNLPGQALFRWFSFSHSL